MSLVTFTFSPGDPITAAEHNTNNEGLADGLSEITADQISDDAGIRSEQMADKFNFHTETIEAAPRFESDGTTIDYTLPDEDDSPGSELDRIYLVLPDGKQAFLIAVIVYLVAVTPNGGINPTWWVTYNGNVLGGSNPTGIDSAGVYYLRDDNDDPLAAVADGGYISVGLGRTTEGGAAPTWSGVRFRFVFKVENSD